VFLQRRLFSANEVFQSVLLHVKMLTERASGSVDGIGIGDEAIIMIKYDTNMIYAMEDFKILQYNQIDLAVEKLKLLKEEIIKITYISCIVRTIKNII
jgi:hypothetical protein